MGGVLLGTSPFSLFGVYKSLMKYTLLVGAIFNRPKC